MCICPKRKRRAAFTLVELLVAVAVLSILMVTMSQLLGTVGRVTSEGKRREDNFSKARSTLEMFSRDVRIGVFRMDLAAFRDSGGNASLCFYTGRPGEGSGLRSLSLVRYQLETASGSLQRGALPVAWDSPAGLVSLGQNSSLPNYSGMTLETMTTGVVRFSVYFLDSTGKLSRQFANLDQANPTRAIGITMAVVDEDTLRLLKADQLSALTSVTGKFPDDPAASPTQSLKTYWERKMEEPGFYNDYPQSIRSGLKIFERYVVLPNQ